MSECFFYFDAAASESHELCPTLCDPTECILLGSSVHGILQARILEWVAIPYPEIELVSLMSPTLASRFFTSATWEALLF